MEEEIRTNTQNKALHLWCKQIADEYNNKGYTVEEVLKNFKMQLHWTPTAVKEIIIKTALARMFGKDSTTQLAKTGEIEKLIDVVTKFNAQLHIEYIPFPSIETDNENIIKN